MADVEDDGEFGSHFLDSMLEVEMTEEDGELDISKNEDPLAINARTLPPVPTFDLQSETLTYKDVYRNSVVQPVLSSLPVAATTEKVPLSVPVIKPAPALALYPREFLPAGATTGVTNNAITIQRSPAKLIPKPIVKPVRKLEEKEELLAAKFLKEVFREEYIKHVFDKKESHTDISVVTDEEMEYYKTCFKDVSKVQYCRLHCTICDKHIGCGEKIAKRAKVHSMLQVLTCKPCHEFYGDGNFPCDAGDNCEIYCRWCAQGGALVCCSFCPRVFCKKCVRRNYGPAFVRSIQKVSDWACFCCAQKPLWPHRAICRALMEYIEIRKTDGKGFHKDTTRCCASVIERRKVKTLERNKIQINATNKPPEAFYPAKTGKEQSLLKMNLQGKVIANNQNKPNIFPKPLVSGNNILRTITGSTPNKVYSSFPAAQFIQGPVLHGETLITPPGSRMLLPAKPTTVTQTSSSFVRVSLTNQTPNLDLSKIPTAKIPHDVQGLILRMSFPDNKVQLVRLLTDGKGCKAGKEFPMPELKHNSVIDENLANAFKLSKTMYDSMIKIRDKIDARTKFTEETVFETAVKKLHFIYEKSIELLKELDQDLLQSHEEWKKEAKSPVDVIDLSEDEDATKNRLRRRTSKFADRCKELVLSDDSDIEILEDESEKRKGYRGSENLPQVSVRSNFKEKYRSRGPPKARGRHVILVEKKKPGRRGRKRLRADKPEESKVSTSEAEPKRGRKKKRPLENGLENPSTVEVVQTAAETAAT